MTDHFILREARVLERFCRMFKVDPLDAVLALGFGARYRAKPWAKWKGFSHA